MVHHVGAHVALDRRVRLVDEEVRQALPRVMVHCTNVQATAPCGRRGAGAQRHRRECKASYIVECVHNDTTIETSRLRLELLLPVALEALRVRDFDGAARAQGFSFSDDFMRTVNDVFLARQIEGQQRRSSTPGWFARAIVRKDDEMLIGHCGFHGTPEDVGRAEIGYTVFESYRRQGYAGEAVQGLLEWAREQGTRVVFASVSADNQPSLAVVAKLDFRQTDVRTSPDGGRELIFQRQL